MESEKHNPTKSKKVGTITPFRISVHIWWWSTLGMICHDILVDLDTDGFVCTY